jgi:hypothetical protein
MDGGVKQETTGNFVAVAKIAPIDKEEWIGRIGRFDKTSVATTRLAGTPDGWGRRPMGG